MTLAFCLRRKQKQLFPQTEALWVIQGFGIGQNLHRRGQRRNLNNVEWRLKTYVCHEVQLLKNSWFGRTAAHHACTPQEPWTARLAGMAAQAIPAVKSCIGFVFRVGILFSLSFQTLIYYQQPVEGDGLTPSTLLPHLHTVRRASCTQSTCFPKAFCVPQRFWTRSKDTVHLFKGLLTVRHIAFFEPTWLHWFGASF